MTRLIASILTGFISGSLITRLAVASATPSAWVAPVVVAGALTLLSISVAMLGESRRPHPFPFVVAMAVAALRQPGDETHPAVSLSGAAVELEAVIEKEPGPSRGELPLRLFVRDARLIGSPSSESLGRLMIVVPADDRATRFAPGVSLRARGWLSMRKERLVLAVGTPADLEFATDLESRARSAVADWRSRLSSRLEDRLSPPAAALGRALLLGRRDHDPDRRLAFKRAGAAHLFSVSGLHLGIVAGLLLGLGTLRRLSPSARGIMLLVICGAYAVLTGARPPVSRAWAGLAASFLARATGRGTHAGWVLLVVASLALAGQPRLAGDVSFLLSFSAVAGLVWLGLPGTGKRPARALDRFLDRKRPRRLRRFVGRGLLVSTSALVATAPLSITIFGGIAPAAILSSLMLVPLIAALIVGSAAVLVLKGFGPLVDALARFLVWLAEGLAALPGAWIATPSPPGALLVVHGLVLVVAAIGVANGSRPWRFRLAPILSLLLIVICSGERGEDRLDLEDRNGACHWTARHQGHELSCAADNPTRRIVRIESDDGKTTTRLDLISGELVFDRDELSLHCRRTPGGLLARLGFGNREILILPPMNSSDLAALLGNGIDRTDLLVVPSGADVYGLFESLLAGSRADVVVLFGRRRRPDLEAIASRYGIELIWRAVGRDWKTGFP